MSENVKRWTIEPPVRIYPESNGKGKLTVVAAKDYDALLAERDALREAGDAMAEFHDRYFVESKRLAAWRAATGKDA